MALALNTSMLYVFLVELKKKKKKKSDKGVTNLCLVLFFPQSENRYKICWLSVLKQTVKSFGVVITFEKVTTEIETVLG